DRLRGRRPLRRRARGRRRRPRHRRPAVARAVRAGDDGPPRAGLARDPRSLRGRLPPGRPSGLPRADGGRRVSADRAVAVPPREDWPEPPPRTEGGAALTDVITATFRLNGRLMDIAQRLAREGGLT